MSSYLTLNMFFLLHSQWVSGCEDGTQGGDPEGGERAAGHAGPPGYGAGGGGRRRARGRLSTTVGRHCPALLCPGDDEVHINATTTAVAVRPCSDLIHIGWLLL